MLRIMKMIALLLTAFSMALIGKDKVTDTAFSGSEMIIRILERDDDLPADESKAEQETKADDAGGKEGNTDGNKDHSTEETQVTTPGAAQEETTVTGPYGNADDWKPEKETSGDGPEEPSETYSSKTAEEETVHVHDWKVRTEGIWHDEISETVWVTDKGAYDETVTKIVPVYMDVKICVAACRGCGMTFSGEDYETVIDDCHSHIISVHGNACGYGIEQSYTEKRQSGSETVTETIHHDEEGHYETVVVAEGYEELVTAGYYCSGCQSIR